MTNDYDTPMQERENALTNTDGGIFCLDHWKDIDKVYKLGVLKARPHICGLIQ